MNGAINAIPAKSPLGQPLQTNPVAETGSTSETSEEAPSTLDTSPKWRPNDRL